MVDNVEGEFNGLGYQNRKYTNGEKKKRQHGCLILSSLVTISHMKIGKT